MNKLNSNWEEVKLGEYRDIDLIMGQSPPSSSYNRKGDGLPFLQGKAEFGTTYPAISTYTTKPLKIAQAGDILISVRAPVGDVNLAPFELCIGRGLSAIRIKKGSNLFYFYWFQKTKKLIENIGKGSTFKSITKDELERLSIPVPAVEEQERIAEVLSTVDGAIEKVDEIIKKTQRLKKGLMQRLLTQGIGHKEFKETEIGRIAEEWEVKSLEEIVEINTEQTDPLKKFPNRKFFYIDIDSVENETGLIKNPKELFGKNAPSRARRIVHSNDVLMSTVRPYLKAFAIVPVKYENQICSTGFAVLTAGEKLSPAYLLYILFSKSVIDQCNRMMTGGQYPALNSSQVATIRIPIPGREEQERIAEILSEADRKIELEKRRRARLERIKKGLMEDLLTGRKRVKTL